MAVTWDLRRQGEIVGGIYGRNCRFDVKEQLVIYDLVEFRECSLPICGKYQLSFFFGQKARLNYKVSERVELLSWFSWCLSEC